MLSTEVFTHLVNKQLEPHGLTYEDVKEMPTWYDDHTTTKEKELEFFDYGVDYISKKLKYSKERSRMIMGMFIFEYGLKTENK